MNVQEEIRRLAYDFYEKSGRMGGMELEHWLRAEQIVMAKLSAQGKVQSARVEPEHSQAEAPGLGRSTRPEQARSAAHGEVETAGGGTKKLRKSASTATGSTKTKKTLKKKPETKTTGRTKKTKS